MIHMNRYQELGGCSCQMGMGDVLAIFAELVKAAAPYALTWRIGIYIVNTLIEWVTGGSNQL